MLQKWFLQTMDLNVFIQRFSNQRPLNALYNIAWPSTIHAHIHTPTAESTVQGDDRLVGSSRVEASCSGTPLHSARRSLATFRLPANPLYLLSHMSPTMTGWSLSSRGRVPFRVFAVSDFAGRTWQRTSLSHLEARKPTCFSFFSLTWSMFIWSAVKCVAWISSIRAGERYGGAICQELPTTQHGIN